jgi:pimeloyl-[acyl-carrier protein] methyl ester esterase
VRPLWIFAHGWGLDPSFWDALLASPRLAGEEVVRIDLGFRLAPGAAPVRGQVVEAAALQELLGSRWESGRPLVGVGHSLGFAWLLQSGHAFDALVSVNGFPRFLRDEGFPGVHPRLLARMRDKLPADPEGVTEEFLLRCGLEGPQQGAVEDNRLAEGLAWLAGWDARDALAAHRGPLLALAGWEDPIVPPAMSEASFPAHALRWVEGGGHLLPLTHVERCAKALATLAEELP